MFCGIIGLYNFGKYYSDINLEEKDDINITDQVIEYQIEAESESQVKGRLLMEQKRDDIAQRMWDDYLLTRG